MIECCSAMQAGLLGVLVRLLQPTAGNLGVWQHTAAFVSDVLKKAALSC